jgi:hypothetical protein
VIDSASSWSSATFGSIVTAVGNLVAVGRTTTGDLNIYSTNCKRETVVSPSLAVTASNGTFPSNIARFQGTQFSLLAHGQTCTVQKIDDDANLIGSSVSFTGGQTSLVSLSNGNVMVACYESGTTGNLRTYVLDTNLSVVSSNTISGYHATLNDQNMAQFSDGRVVYLFRNQVNSRGQYRILSETGASVAGPFTFPQSSGVAVGFTTVSQGSEAVILWGNRDFAGSIQSFRINSSGSVQGTPINIDASGGGQIYSNSAQVAIDGSIYYAYRTGFPGTVRYTRLSSTGSVLGGPYTIYSGQGYVSLGLVNDHVVIVTGNGVYVYEQD